MPKSSKVIRKRIKSVASTKKITRTMEMVATSKLAKTQGKVVGSRPYTTTLGGLLAPSESAKEPLAARADHHHGLKIAERRGGAQQRQVVTEVLAEPDPRGRHNHPVARPFQGGDRPPTWRARDPVLR